MSFVQRKIDLTISLGPVQDAQGNIANPNQTDTFGPGLGNTVTVSGLRVSAKINLTGGPGMSDAMIRVNGLTRQVMDKLSSLGKPLLSYRTNGITVQAGDDTGGMFTVFSGGFYAAYQDFAAMPDNAFVIHAHAGIQAAMKPVAPVSYNGPTDVAVVMQNIAGQLGYTFENSGVQGVILPSPYLHGTLLDQANKAAADAGINLYIDEATVQKSTQDAADTNVPTGTLAIWPKNGSRGGAVPKISPASGLVGWPTFTDSGCMVKCLFNPNLKAGGQFTLSNVPVGGGPSLLPAADGDWYIRYLNLELEANTPGGSWFSVIDALRLSLVGTQ